MKKLRVFDYNEDIIDLRIPSCPLVKNPKIQPLKECRICDFHNGSVEADRFRDNKPDHVLCSCPYEKEMVK